VPARKSLCASAAPLIIIVIIIIIIIIKDKGGPQAGNWASTQCAAAADRERRWACNKGNCDNKSAASTPLHSSRQLEPNKTTAAP